MVDYDPTIEDSFRKRVTIDGETGLLDIMDTACCLSNQEDYSPQRDHYMRTCEGVLLIYSITSLASFEEIKNWREHILRLRDTTTFPMVLCGNKSDLAPSRQITPSEGTTLAQTWHLPFFETSALSRTNVEESFYTLVREIKKSREPPARRQKGGCLLL
uniref:Uncharacterized protein n=1 Tax=Arcella intermedia TaxID=1963864 RepID=A0A6B2LL49_9EUKA